MTTEEFAREMQVIEEKGKVSEEQNLINDIIFTFAAGTMLVVLDRFFDISIIIAKAIELVGTKLM